MDHQIFPLSSHLSAIISALSSVSIPPVFSRLNCLDIFKSTVGDGSLESSDSRRNPGAQVLASSSASKHHSNHLIKNLAAGTLALDPTYAYGVYFLITSITSDNNQHIGLHAKLILRPGQYNPSSRTKQRQHTTILSDPTGQFTWGEQIYLFDTIDPEGGRIEEVRKGVKWRVYMCRGQAWTFSEVQERSGVVALEYVGFVPAGKKYTAKLQDLVDEYLSNNSGLCEMPAISKASKGTDETNYVGTAAEETLRGYRYAVDVTDPQSHIDIRGCCTFVSDQLQRLHALGLHLAWWYPSLSAALDTVNFFKEHYCKSLEEVSRLWEDHKKDHWLFRAVLENGQGVGVYYFVETQALGNPGGEAAKVNHARLLLRVSDAQEETNRDPVFSDKVYAVDIRPSQTSNPHTYTSSTSPASFSAFQSAPHKIHLQYLCYLPPTPALQPLLDHLSSNAHASGFSLPVSTWPIAFVQHFLALILAAGVKAELSRRYADFDSALAELGFWAGVYNKPEVSPEMALEMFEGYRTRGRVHGGRGRMLRRWEKWVGAVGYLMDGNRGNLEKCVDT